MYLGHPYCKETLMTTPRPLSAPKKLLLPNAPVLAVDGAAVVCLDTDGEIRRLTQAEARRIAAADMPILCHAPYMAKRLGLDRIVAYDVLELFAFVRPGKFCVPTPRGIAKGLDLFEPLEADDQCMSLRDSARHLLSELMDETREEKTDPAGIAGIMGRIDIAGGADGWAWTQAVLAALGANPSRTDMRAALRVWDKLPEWSVHAPEPAAGHEPVSEDEAAERLHKLLVRQKKEDRPQQQSYAKALTHAFSPVNAEGETNIVMAEAGTGTGKTLGYLAPATVWAEKNRGAVWISTYTRNLQRQIDAELDKLYDDPATKARKAVTRKGRENYLCLLNLEDAGASAGAMADTANAVALGLLTRWAGVTEDGDLGGKDFPGWLPGLLGFGRVQSFADRRGECIYAGCTHFDKCFVEKSVRKAKRADIVIANHALVMHQAAVAGPEDALPARFIFDEGHHLFEAADSAFDMELNGQWTSDLRRWILGSEISGGKKSRARGLKRRLEDLIVDDEGAQRDIEAVLEAARVLPGQQWRQRLAEGMPKGECETFLDLCRRQVYARSKDTDSFYSLETGVSPAIPGLLEAAEALASRLRALQKPMQSLVSRLQKKLTDDPEALDSAMRERLRFGATSLYRRSHYTVGAWVAMLESLKDKTPAEFCDWLEVTRTEGRDTDTGFYRYYVDPAKVFAQQLKPHAVGAVITSASLRDIAPEDAEGWKSPASRTGLEVLKDGHDTARFFSAASPFDYARQTKILVVGDVSKGSTDEAASAFRALFTAAGGGALGIFTSVQRLKAVHGKIAMTLEDAGLPLLAQHVDPLDTGTLIDIFREEENACLLGTDATRDGIDVPGRSLRLVVYDRVPWPRPTLLHKSRRDYFGRGYDDTLTRFKLKQAYGRLIRRADDKGVFVMLDGALPTRLCAAFPEGVEIQRIGLKEAIETVKGFL